MKNKELGDWTFEELVDHCTHNILQELLMGRLRHGVWAALDVACRWSRAKEPKVSKKKS